MPAIHFGITVDAEPEPVYDALATDEGLAGNWTDQLEVPEETGCVARFGFGPDWAKTLEVRVDALERGRRVEWAPVGGFPGWIGTTIRWDLEPAEDGGTSCTSSTPAGRTSRPTARWRCAANVGDDHDRLAAQAARGERAPYCTADAPLPR